MIDIMNKKYFVNVGSLGIELDANGVINLNSESMDFNNKSNLEKIRSNIRIKEDNKNLILYLNNTKVAVINKKTSQFKSRNISNFSLKNLLHTNNSENVNVRTSDVRYKPRTDIHTHLGGVLSASECIDILKNNNIKLPDNITSQLKTERNVKVEDLDEASINKLTSLLSIPIDKQSTFLELEEIYSNRGFINKDPSLFRDILQSMGNKYKKEGIEYAEISFSSITDPEYINIINEELPRIEKELGVTLTFMAGIWRHSDDAWVDYEVDKLKSAIHNPYIVGLDVMGHETNSILEIKEKLIQMGREIKAIDPDFNLRIHAGENKVHPENVYESLLIAQDAGVNCRIGHGLYGFNDKALNLAKKNNSIIEFNLHSNLSLNNINGIFDGIKKIIGKGIPFVFSSDGGGIYNGSAADSLSAAGLSKSQVEILKDVEEKYIKSKKTQIKRKQEASVSKDLPNKIEVEPYISRSREIEKIKEQSIKNLISEVKDKGIRLVSEKTLNNILKEKRITVISGASKNSWPLISEDQQKEVKLFLEECISEMDPNKDLIFTGGTDFGVEREVHRIALKNGIKVVGTLTEDASIDQIKKDTLDSAILIKGGWYNKNANVLNLIKNASNKSVLFIGGGDIVATEIQSLINYNEKENKNRKIPISLMDLNGQGASSEELSDNPQLGFKNNTEYKKINGENIMKPIKYQENEEIMKLFNSAPEYMKSAKTLGAVPNESNISEVFENLKEYTDGMNIKEDERVIPDENGLERVVKKDCVLDTYVLDSMGVVVVEKSNLITNNVVIASNVEPVKIKDSGEIVVNSWLVQKEAWIKNYGKLPDSEENKPYQKIATMKAITITPELLSKLGSTDGKSAKIHIDYDNGEMEVFLGGKLSDQGYGITKEEFAKTYSQIKKEVVNSKDFDEVYDSLVGAKKDSKNKTDKAIKSKKGIS
jgi:adenosine deaminase